jgi:hypothetical protein
LEQHLNAARREAERVLSNVAQPRMAVVSSYDQDRYAIKARLQPENTETGWMPLGSLSVGNGFGIFAPPAIGDQIFVLFQEGAGGSPVAIASLYSDEDRPVVEGLGGTPAGEMRIVSSKGARIRLLADGQIEIRQKAGTQVVLKPDGTVTINGPTVLVGGEGASFLRLLDQRFHAWAVSHTHPQVGPPLSPPTLDASATTSLKGA